MRGPAVYERMAFLKDLPPQELETVVAAIVRGQINGPKPIAQKALGELSAAGMQRAPHMQIIVKRPHLYASLMHDDARD